MRYVANIEIDVPGFEDIAEFDLQIEGDFEMVIGSNPVLTEWWIEEVNGVGIDTIPEVEAAIIAKLDDEAVSRALYEYYYEG